MCAGFLTQLRIGMNCTTDQSWLRLSLTSITSESSMVTLAAIFLNWTSILNKCLWCWNCHLSEFMFMFKPIISTKKISFIISRVNRVYLPILLYLLLWCLYGVMWCGVVSVMCLLRLISAAPVQSCSPTCTAAVLWLTDWRKPPVLSYKDRLSWYSNLYFQLGW